MDIIDPIFNLHKIKFDILDKWLLIDKTTERGIVYINLDNVFKLILTPRVNNFIQAGASMQGYDEYMKQVSLSIVSNIINLGQHYRLWLSKHSIDSRIILYWNYPLPEDHYRNDKYIATYRDEHKSKYSMGIETSHILLAINKAIKFCKTCIEYINEVYLLSANDIDASLIPYVLNENVYKQDGVKTKNFIVSNSQFEFPYVNYGFTLLCPSVKKKTPYYINSMNVLTVLKDRYKTSTPLSVNNNLLEFINAIMGDHDRNIPSITGIGLVSVLRMINVAIQQGHIAEDTKDIEMLKSIISEKYREMIERNYHCTNIEYQYKDLEPLDIHKILSQLVDNYDERTLNEMNDKYFKLCPIEIIRPKSEQVLYDRNPYENSIFVKK